MNDVQTPKLRIAIVATGGYCLVIDGVRTEPVYETAAEAIKARERFERKSKAAVKAVKS